MRNINRQLVTSCQRLRTKAVAKVLHFSTENGIVMYFFVVFGQVFVALQSSRGQLSPLDGRPEWRKRKAG